MIKVSIIVPIYNTDPFLTQCLESLVNQTLQEIELILVDDGSTDRCGEIVESFAKRDPRIRVIRQENKGVSAARNAGLEVATGEYIGFMDSDDWADPSMFQFLYEKAKEHDADLHVCDFFEESDDRVVSAHRGIIDELVNVNQSSRTEYLSEYAFNNRYTGCVMNKLYKSALINHYRLRFEEAFENSSEDTLFNYLCLTHLQRVVSSGMSLFHYRIRAGSLSQGYRPRYLEHKRLLCERFCEHVEEHGLSEPLHHFCDGLWFMSFMVVVNYSKKKGIGTSKTIQAFKRVFREKKTREPFKRFAFGKAASLYSRYKHKNGAQQFLMRLFAFFLYIKFWFGLRLLITLKKGRSNN